MSSDQDFVEKLFNASFKLARKSIDIADNTTHSVINSIGTIKDKILDSSEVDVFQPETVTTTKGIFSGMFPGINSVEPIKENWMYGLSISATALLIIWKWNKLLTLPDHIPQNENLCVLVLGDMSDPIIRSQVMDLYRRRFIIFVCSENSSNFKQFEEETDFIHPINPASPGDLTFFTEFITQVSDPPRKLASILFMPNLSYQPTGELSVENMQHELKTNILTYYSTLIKLIPHLPNSNTQIILFNPKLTYNLGTAHHATELFISGFITSIFNALQNYKSLSVSMVNLGLFQVRGQLSNYKHMRLTGNDISSGLHAPIYKMIMRHNGHLLQRFVEHVCTCGGKYQTYYLGKFSYLSSLPFAQLLIKFQISVTSSFEFTRKFIKEKWIMFH
ncbi:similar to Saccharomyces cerevisiae YHR017W YSC83 Non-essential mitochondrial protein of unknown function [Maudiozyma barnettii]|uniref:Uncharacterized protein n=1 Tax=Maudiozyma barnettii TaxID=61262 RepID=A0A8H2VEQ9_9SACH|nr:Ysc83p [Kazachstania barnettii]CAB4254239.1 similar to Saccharomyces cerevisiae YHR017W YSC83 Non-essential mitochondrial protein of unknown function [Kazachstania barnettii]CAD1781989.1 similar to Saccharomyces cerevisiae YHR017W YSC83 Non-essential mitochondrial protein of unknown function [Kazachstania barnettii]